MASAANASSGYVVCDEGGVASGGDGYLEYSSGGAGELGGLKSGFATANMRGWPGFRNSRGSGSGLAMGANILG